MNAFLDANGDGKDGFIALERKFPAHYSSVCKAAEPQVGNPGEEPELLRNIRIFVFNRNQDHAADHESCSDPLPDIKPFIQEHICHDRCKYDLRCCGD